jgi:hypothetical protein
MWTKTNSTISGTLYTDPSGTSTANELVEDILLAAHTCQQGTGTSATIGSTYTFSVFVKRKTSSNQFLLIGASGLVSASFMSVNLTNGVTATGIGSPAAPINVSSTAYPNGWYRVQFSVVATAAASITLDIRLSRDGTWANRSYLGDGVQSSLIWGAQVEVGSFPTSYIPTTTASVVRSVDVCSITGAAFTGFYNQSEGTAVMKFTNGDTASFPQLFTFNQTAAPFANRIYVVGYNRMQNTEVKIITSSVDQLSHIGSLTNKSGNISLAYKTNDAAYAKDGVIVTTDNTVSLGTSIDRLQLQEFNGCITSFRYFKKRLANSKLQTLTA